jgi:hypothetical protein
MLLQWGITPMHRAAEKEQHGVVGLLLGAGAAVNAADKVRPTLMEAAAWALLM